jgi:hypothetical protein
MTPSEALREAARAGYSGQFEVSSHCLRRMRERNVTRRDICLALRSATTAAHEDGEKWCLKGGRDDDGEALAVVIVFTGHGLIVSVF